MSEFGKGCTYCIGLFIAHQDRFSELRRDKKFTLGASSWFNASSDHLYDLQIPKGISKQLEKRMKTWQTKCLTWGHGFKEPSATEKDVTWSLKEAKELLRILDKQFLKVDVEEGEYE